MPEPLVRVHLLMGSRGDALWREVLPLIAVGEVVVLLQDMVYPGLSAAALTRLPASVRVYLLRGDCLARGVELADFAQVLQAPDKEQMEDRYLDDAGLVRLLAQSDANVSWW